MATTTVLSSGKEGLDLKEFRQLTRDLKRFKPDKQLKKVLRGAGQLIAEDAKSNVEQYSQTVPPSIKVRIRGTSVSVVGGGAGVPLGGLLELGNKGKGKSQAASKSGKFRHPVFGNSDVWVEQDMHPYLLPASAHNARSIEHFEGAIVADAFREIGWR